MHRASYCNVCVCVCVYIYIYTSLVLLNHLYLTLSKYLHKFIWSLFVHPSRWHCIHPQLLSMQVIRMTTILFCPPPRDTQSPPELYLRKKYIFNSSPDTGRSRKQLRVQACARRGKQHKCIQSFGEKTGRDRYHMNNLYRIIFKWIENEKDGSVWIFQKSMRFLTRQ